ncbi:hypothetical protein [Sorangium sp. So ce117]
MNGSSSKRRAGASYVLPSRMVIRCEATTGALDCSSIHPTER